MAHTFLLLDPKPTGYAFIVKHPYTDNAFVTLEVGKKEYVPANILEDSTAMKKWRENVSRIIENAKNPRHVYMGLTKSYRFAFLKYAMPYMSQKDFSEYLADAWVLCEAPNRDPNFTKRQMIGLFQKADPRILMSDDEYDRLQNLEIITTVYRGVTEYNADKVKALSWTLNPKTAKWFAHRFDENGTVYKARISKTHILAFLIPEMNRRPLSIPDI